MPSNAELHRQMDQALDEGNVDAAREYMADDMVAHFVGDSPLAGAFNGQDAFFEAFQRVIDLTDGSLSIEHRDVLESEEHSVALTKMSATRSGNAFEGDVVDVCRWQGGKLVEEWVIPFDQKSFDAFWS